MIITVQRPPSPFPSLEDCQPVRFPPSNSSNVGTTEEHGLDTITFDFPARLGSDTKSIPQSLLVLIALFVVHYRSTGVENATLGILDDNSKQSTVRVHIDSETPLSNINVVRDATQGVQTSGKHDLPKIIIVSTGVSIESEPAISSKLNMEWSIDLECHVSYDSALYSRTEVQNIWEKVLDVMVVSLEQPELPVGEVPFRKVRQQLERSGIPIKCPPSPSYTFTTLSDAFHHTVITYPDHVAIVNGKTSLTYAELDFYSSALTHKITGALDGRNDSGYISWCLPPSPLAIVVMFAIVKYGATYVPLDIRLPCARLNSLIADSGACLLITSNDSPDFSLDNPEQVARLDVTNFLREHTSYSSTYQSRSRPVMNKLAYVMYTSGSTGKPKGVCISQESVLALVYDRGRFPLGPNDRVAQINNLAWDGSIFEVWCTLLAGATLVSFNRYDVLEPVILAKQFNTLDVQCTFITTSLFRQILNVAPDLFKPLRTLLVGGESIDFDQYRKLHAVNPFVKLFNMYGPTETCCYTTSYIVPMDDLPTQGVVPIGIGLEHTQCLVVDSKNRLVPPGIIGELVIGGRGVGAGYLERRKETTEHFVKMRFPELDQPGAVFYRSGDLVRWLPTRELQFEGRLKAGQVKIRGQRLEMTEVEAACVRSGLVTHAAVAFVKPTDGREAYLASFLVRKPIPDVNGTQTFLPTLGRILKVLRSTLPSYMIPRDVHFVESLPLTSSGKLDRRSLQGMALAADSQETGVHNGDYTDTYVAPQSELERHICGIFGEILPKSGVFGATSDFFDAGGHSLLAMRLKWRLQQTFHDQMSMQDIFAETTPRRLAARIEALKQSSPDKVAVDLRSFPQIGEGEYRPLTLGEARFWYAAKVDGPDDPTFFCPHWLHMDGFVDEDVLERSITFMVGRHEVFRTVFLEVDGIPRGKIIDFFAGMERMDVDPNLDQEAFETLLRGHAMRPFKFGEDVMFRAILFRVNGGEKSILLFALHHMITDGFSRDVIFREVSEAYNAFIDDKNPTLPPVPVQYTAFAQWHNTSDYEQLLEAQTQYWSKELQGGKAADFPLDFPRPQPKDTSRDGGLISVVCTSEMTHQLEVLCKEAGITIYILLLTVLRIVHYQLTAETDACLASSIANRTRPEAESLCGYFVNNIVYRIKLDGQNTVGDILKQVRQLYLGALANQDVPFWPRIAEKLRSDPTKPIYRTVMGYHRFNTTSLKLGNDVCAKAWDLDLQAVRFDFQVFFNREGDQIVGDFHYRKDLFKEATVKGIVDRYFHVLQVLAGGLQERVLEMSLNSVVRL
ncbi:NRPS protein [Marasmius oreades]|uniref:NRPS protein n=1 Tax=Marasmius oreades TaxID=181124 RepID=A0A9P7RW72_9AGAR|nr:NRPS protein [Marasmius oreades]KAG7090924.1 NRPS protein [Marasmius oreades]